MSDFVLPVNPKLLVKEERIVWAAIKVFSQYPFSVATVKMIADEAELPLSAVMYYHKSKESLYETIFERLIPPQDKSLERHRLFLESFDDTDRETARQILEGCLGEMVDGLYDDEKKNWYFRILFFEWLYPSPLQDTLFEKYFKEKNELFIRLLQAATGHADRDQVVLLSVGVMGHLIGFRLFRDHLVKQTKLVGFSKEEKERIKTMIVRNAMFMIQESEGKTANE